MKFELTKEQEKKLDEWKNSLPEILDFATIGGAYTYQFTPTGLGVGLTVKREDGHEIDLTEYEKW